MPQRIKQHHKRDERPEDHDLKHRGQRICRHVHPDLVRFRVTPPTLSTTSKIFRPQRHRNGTESHLATCVRPCLLSTNTRRHNGHGPLAPAINRSQATRTHRSDFAMGRSAVNERHQHSATWPRVCSVRLRVGWSRLSGAARAPFPPRGFSCVNPRLPSLPSRATPRLTCLHGLSLLAELLGGVGLSLVSCGPPHFKTHSVARDGCRFHPHRKTHTSAHVRYPHLQEPLDVRITSRRSRPHLEDFRSVDHLHRLAHIDRVLHVWHVGSSQRIPQEHTLSKNAHKLCWTGRGHRACVDVARFWLRTASHPFVPTDQPDLFTNTCEKIPQQPAQR